MYEALDARFELDEGAKLGHACDRAADALAGQVTLRSGLPLLGLKLLEAQRNLLGFGVDFEDADLQLLAHGQHVFGLADAAPRNVADVEQAVDSAKVNKRAVAHEAADRAGNRVAFFHGCVAVCRG